MCDVHKKISLELLEPFLHSFKGLKFRLEYKTLHFGGCLISYFSNQSLNFVFRIKILQFKPFSIMTKKVHKNNNILQVPKYAVE